MLAIGRHFVEPYYFAYATAAAHYRFTSQSRTTVWIATSKHVPDRTIRGTRFRFISLVNRKFFGYESTEVFHEKVNLSDPEKTVIDCVDRPDLAGGIGEVTRIIALAARVLDWGNLSRHALQFNSVATVQRLGYLARRVHVEIPNDCLQQLRSLLRKNSRSFLAFPGKWGRTGTMTPSGKSLSMCRIARSCRKCEICFHLLGGRPAGGAAEPPVTLLPLLSIWISTLMLEKSENVLPLKIGVVFSDSSFGLLPESSAVLFCDSESAPLPENRSIARSSVRPSSVPRFFSFSMVAAVFSQRRFRSAGRGRVSAE